MKKIFLFLGLIFLVGLVSAECIDTDGDGYGLNQTDCTFSAIDCNDLNSSINPGAEEICGNGIDEDCSGADKQCIKCADGPIYFRCSCEGNIHEPNMTQPEYCCNDIFKGTTKCEWCTESISETISCTTEQGCPGRKVCLPPGIYTKCHDTEDNCPCDENWDCGEWGTCTNRIQTRDCTDLNGCSTFYSKPSEIISCGECNPGITQTCVTTQSCPGTQVCQSDSSWNACSDIPNDNCPIVQPPQEKEFFVMILPEVLKDETKFTVTVIEENAIQNARIEYANNVYLTNSGGQAEITAKKEFDLLKISKTNFITQTIVLNIIKHECGNGVCEAEYENTTNCPADCETVSTEMKINTSLSGGNVLTILVTDAKDEPLSNVQVIYGGETKSTNTQGITTFEELSGEKTITAIKEGYQTKIITYVAVIECTEGETKECSTEECPGTQICENGKWSVCIDVKDNCPGEFADTTILLTVVFIMGIMLLAGVKIFT